MRMHSHPVRLDVWLLVAPFVYFHTSSVRTAKALVGLRGYAGSPEPSLVTYVISTIISWAGSFYVIMTHQVYVSSPELQCYWWDLSPETTDTPLVNERYSRKTSSRCPKSPPQHTCLRGYQQCISWPGVVCGRDTRIGPGADDGRHRVCCCSRLVWLLLPGRPCRTTVSTASHYAEPNVENKNVA